MVTRAEALKVIEERGQSPNIIKHLISVGGAMRSLAAHFGEDPDRWEIAGILHDADYNLAPLEHHGFESADWFAEQIDDEIRNAVIAHNFSNNKVEPASRMAWSLYAVDNLAGLIIAAALVRPDKKLDGLATESVLKRFKEPSFAKGANREEILACEKVGLSLPEFTTLSLSGIKELAGPLGL